MITIEEYCRLFVKGRRLTEEEDDKIKEFNKALIEKYPFLKPHNLFNADEDKSYDYQFTLLDSMPVGWRSAFGEKMCEEIKQTLSKIPYNPKDNYDESPVCENDNWLNHYRVIDIKEKYGTLRWYSNFEPDELTKIIDKYEDLSWKTCILCGEQSTLSSKGWISPYCDKCAQTLLDDRNKLSENKLTIEDLFEKRK